MTHINQKIPEGWSVKKLGDICHINKSSLSEKTSKDYKFKYIDLSSVDEGKIEFPTDDIGFGEASSRARRKINKNDIIMSTVRPNLKGFAFIDFDSTDFICSTGFAVLTAKEHAYNRYIYQLLYSKNIETQINNMLAGSNYPAINSSDVASLKIALPPLPEQEKIAGILGTWDEAIEKLSSLIEQKKLLKKGLMQRLLTGKTRLSTFTQPWKDIELSDLLNYEQPSKYLVGEILPYDKNKIPVLTANKAFILGSTDDSSGIYTQGDCIIFDDFTTDIKYVNFPFKVKSSAIKILTPKTNTNLKFVYEQMKCIKYPLAGHKRYYLSEYQYITISIPDISEQQAIADVLSTADDEINLLNQKLEALKEQKKGLMQQLLTGQIRVKVN